MNFFKSPPGITLIETLIYIGLLVLVLPPLILTLIRVTQEVGLLDARSRINTEATLIVSQLFSDFTSANQIRISQSTLITSPGVIVFLDSTGTVVMIDRPTLTVALPGGNQTMHSLRLTRGTSPAIYLTDPDIDVRSWKVDAVRNSLNILTGIRFHLDLSLLNQSTAGPYQNAQFVSDFTVDLQPQTTES